MTERTSDRFRVGLGLIAFGALLLRTTYVNGVSASVGGDGLYYHTVASLIADGKGFISPEPFLRHARDRRLGAAPPGVAAHPRRARRSSASAPRTSSNSSPA